MQALRGHRSPYTSNSQRMFLRKGPSLSGSETDVSTSTENLTVEEKSVLFGGVRQEPQGEETLGDFDSVCSNTLIVHHNPPFDCHSSPFYSKANLCRLQRDKTSQQRRSCSPKRSPHFPPHYAPAQVQEITDIPAHYLDQSEVLKYLAKEVHRQTPDYTGTPQGTPPPPEYPRWRDSPKKTQLDRMSISHSHPDLSHLGVDETKLSLPNQRPKTKGRPSLDVNPESSVSQAGKIIELLSAENASLKNELELYKKKVTRLQNFEMEIQKVHRSHEELVQSTEKREKLERTVRSRLEGEVRRLQEANRELKEQLDATSGHLYRQQINDSGDAEMRKELSKRDVLVAQLLSQNKELLAEKERHEAELHAQGATLQEQRNHIDILDNALNNAQANVVKLEEENRKKQAYVDRVAQLQRALANLQLASDRRLQMEKKVREQLEKEIETLRAEKEPGKQSGGIRKQDTEEMKRTMREYQEKIIALEAEVSKWEQRYLEESTMRQIEVDAASVPKDAKIAALERTSQESEKLIAQARSEKLRQMDELYAAQRKSAELEGQIKDLESKLAERNAMIRVLRHHSQEKDAVLQSAVLGRPPRHTRAASTMGLTSVTPTSSLSTTGSSTTLHCHKDDADISSSNVAEQECATGEDLDARLSSKDSIMSALHAEKALHPNHFWMV